MGIIQLVLELASVIFSAPTITVLAFGFLLGLKHATEADHLAAVSAIVATRKGLFGSAIIGGIWGVGHTLSLLIAGSLVLWMGFQISERIERILEFSVGIMLVLLGVNVLQKLLRGAALHFHTHKHGDHIHAHPHLHKDSHMDQANTHHFNLTSKRTLIVGMIHGLAGSAALMLLVIPTIQSHLIGILYIIIFGIGSISGMMLMSFLLSLPLYFTSSRFSRVNLTLRYATGLISVYLGLLIIYQKSFIEGL